MKTLKHVIILAAALCAVSAQAGPSFSLAAPSTVSTTVGGSGFSVFTLTVRENTYFDGFGAPYSENPSAVFNGIFSVVSFDAAHSSSALAGLGGTGTAFSAPHQGGYLVGAGTYDLAISWTVSGSTTPDFYVAGLGANVVGYTSGNYLTSGFKYTAFDVAAASVPEPSQAIAGCMLLGCGGLVFVSRRFVKKQAK